MPKLLLTDRALTKITTPGSYWDSSTPAFGVRVGKHAKTFMVVKSDGTRVKLGRFPNISLKAARRKAVLSQTAPDLEYQRRSAAETVEEYLRSLKLRHATKTEYERLLERLAFKDDLQAITAYGVLDRISHFTPSEARHQYFAASAFLSWCVSMRYLRSNALSGVKCPYKQNSRERTLTNDELKAITNALSKSGFSDIVRLLILTGQRRSQIAGLRAVWLQNDVIVFPAGIMKGKAEHTIPATTRVRALIRDYSFTGWSQSKARLDTRAKVYDWTLHDLRRTFSTIHARIGTPPHVTEAILDHKTGTRSQIQRIYDRHTYLPEMRAALENYETQLEKLCSAA